MSEVSEIDVRKAVRERYARLAIIGDSSCCGENSNCCTPSAGTEDIPLEASSVNAGCGSPLALISPKTGDVVLDLGSGGGIDVFRASSLVGETGQAIGVDATPEMIWRARDTAKKYGDRYQNVEFRLGEIEKIPVMEESVDYVISNCVINLSPEKQRVFNEAFRVLKPGGVFAVADITVEEEIPDSERKNMNSWSACVSGSISKENYRRMLKLAGFAEISIEDLQNEDTRNNADAPRYPFKTFSSHIKARKPVS
jgi:arsenite methyltransferase